MRRSLLRAPVAPGKEPDGGAARPLTEDERLIRQFLRGDAEGPITERKQSTNYADDLLGDVGPKLAPRASVQATR